MIRLLFAITEAFMRIQWTLTYIYKNTPANKHKKTVVIRTKANKNIAFNFGIEVFFSVKIMHVIIRYSCLKCAQKYALNAPLWRLSCILLKGKNSPNSTNFGKFEAQFWPKTKNTLRTGNAHFTNQRPRIFFNWIRFEILRRSQP